MVLEECLESEERRSASYRHSLSLQSEMLIGPRPVASRFRPADASVRSDPRWPRIRAESAFVSSAVFTTTAQCRSVRMARGPRGTPPHPPRTQTPMNLSSVEPTAPLGSWVFVRPAPLRMSSSAARLSEMLLRQPRRRRVRRSSSPKRQSVHGFFDLSLCEQDQNDSYYDSDSKVKPALSSRGQIQSPNAEVRRVSTAGPTTCPCRHPPPPWHRGVGRRCNGGGRRGSSSAQGFPRARSTV